MIPFPVAAPVSEIAASLMALFPLVTVNVTYVGTPVVTVAGLTAKDNDCVLAEVIVVEPSA